MAVTVAPQAHWRRRPLIFLLNILIASL